MSEQVTEKNDVLECLFRLMRLTRRHPVRGGHHGHGDHRLLLLLKEHSGASSRELAERLDVRPSSLTEMVQRQEERGTIDRVRDETDARVYRISLSEKGKKQLDAQALEMQRAQQEYVACLTAEERETFCAICNKLSDHLTEQHKKLHQEHHHKHGHGQAWDGCKKGKKQERRDG
ncbi:MarR family transcriptional regulator [Eubacteriales bacterium OttesenSCG-928-M02]|nr:MarR family transcriptional regulator [Eubacteriales bacterium OttesenSCG-928-M02]